MPRLPSTKLHPPSPQDDLPLAPVPDPTVPAILVAVLDDRSLLVPHDRRSRTGGALLTTKLKDTAKFKKTPRAVHKILSSMNPKNK